MRRGLKFYTIDMLRTNEYTSKDKSPFTGGLVCRGLLSTIPDHNVDTLIAVSSPMAGMYGGLYAMLYDGTFVKLEYLLALIKLFMRAVLHIN